MANQLFKTLGNSNSNVPAPLGNLQTLVEKLNQFKNSFSGDPKQQVQQLLNSGRMTQNQYNQLSQMATQIQNMLADKS